MISIAGIGPLAKKKFYVKIKALLMGLTLFLAN